MEKDDCRHPRQQYTLIGHDNTAGSLFYKISVCLDCGKYIDIMGNLIEFQNTVSEKIGMEWRWNDQYMPEDQLATMKPGLTRLSCRIINPK
ncbi:MAG: hypothetical protein Q7S77_01805 [Candidatus Staskawiczbacteria bacterium]|nr:hypothetical protein [Candidatus Staskawiczbacteria bacterium]